MEELERVTKERLVKGTEFPSRFNFEEKGQKLLGKIISYRNHPMNPKTRVATVRTLDGKEYSVTLSSVLERLFVDQNVQVDDYIYVVYEGVGKSKVGRRVKLFSLAKMTSDEAEKIVQKIPEPAKAKPEVIKPPEVPKEEVEEIREFFSRLLEFYDEGLTREQIMERIDKKFPKISIDRVLEICDFMMYDSENKVFKKKKE